LALSETSERPRHQQLIGAPQDDLCAPVIVLNRPLDFNLVAFKLADVAQLFLVRRKYNHHKSTGLGLLAKV
jgi:hypothetical protein